MAKPDNFPKRKLTKLADAKSIDEVLANFDAIIEWSIKYENGIGYFATVYRRATEAIKGQLIAGNYFDDNARMTRFAIIFAQRYFDALNAYFHPAPYQAPTHTWQWCFDGHEYESPDHPIILQHMLTAVNAHVNLDLGIAAAQAAGKGRLRSMEEDFNRINVLLADEMTLFLDALAKRSKGVKVIRRTLVCEDRLLDRVLRVFRDLAWSFANQLDEQSDRHRGRVAVHDAWAGVLGTYYLHPNDTINGLVKWIRDGESQDVAENIRVFAGRK